MINTSLSATASKISIKLRQIEWLELSLQEMLEQGEAWDHERPKVALGPKAVTAVVTAARVTVPLY